LIAKGFLARCLTRFRAGFSNFKNGAGPEAAPISKTKRATMQLHRATTVCEPIPPNISSSCHRKPCAVYGDGEAHSLSVSADRDVLLARIEIAEAYYRGGDSLALDMLASSSLRLYGHVFAGDLAAIDLFDDLQECAANLGIAERGQYRELQATSTKEWLVHGLLGAGDASAFYGVPGCGKSVLIEDMALHIAAGREWHGRAVQHGAVLYVALERKKISQARL
jgi:AAA domain-containing protein